MGAPPKTGKQKRKAMRMPYRSGNPEWIEREYEHYDENPKSAPSTYGNGPAVEPYEHFEILRKAQKDWWGAEVYGRICMLTGQIHLIQGFGYWLTIHCIAELGMYWSAQVLAGAFSAAVWLLFHLDVLPDKGGFWPVEACGPFLSALTLLLQYSHSPTPFILNTSRVTAICVIILNMIFTIRLLMIASPANMLPGHAREAGNQKNLSASCEHPAWLPTAYQHVQYLVAPPKSAKDPKLNERDAEDPMENVDMMPWRATRAMYIACILLWGVLLVGRIVECAMGERMLMTNPGFPPWTRIGQWDGWESGPITSKHYAHVTPMRGHFAWKYGQGPNGYVEIWPSDLYGFAPEADMWWADEHNPDKNAPPGKAVHKIPSYPLEVIPQPPHSPEYNTPDYGKHHRRMETDFLQADVTRPLVPAPVKWPTLLEPDFVACAPSSHGGQVAAFSASGHGALISQDAASGKVPGVAAPFSFEGLPSPGFARGVTWGHDGLTVVSGHGTLHSCSHVAGSQRFTCETLSGPSLSLPVASEGTGPLPAVAVAANKDGLRFAAVATEGGEVNLMHLGMDWEFMAKVQLPFNEDNIEAERPSVVALSAAEDHLIVSASDGATYRWKLEAGLPSSTPHRETPASAGTYAAIGSPRTWRGACLLPTGKTIRLASRWQKSGGAGALAWHPELLF